MICETWQAISCGRISLASLVKNLNQLNDFENNQESLPQEEPGKDLRPFNGIDITIGFKLTNDWITQIADIANQKNFSNRITTASSLTAKLESQIASLSQKQINEIINFSLSLSKTTTQTTVDRMAFFTTNMLLPDWSSTNESWCKYQTKMRLLVVASAIKSKYLKPSNYPDTLSTKSLGTLLSTEMFSDPFMPQRKFGYRKEPSGFMVWSVNVDGDNDNGNQRSQTDENDKGDLTIQISTNKSTAS